jgi:SagB-type dehydrogenase family enzyme
MSIDHSWQSTVLPTQEDDELWETFHENSKFNNYHEFPPQDYIQKHMESMWESFPMQNRQITLLPKPKLDFQLDLAEAITTRISGRVMERCSISLQTISNILFCGYGETRSNLGTGYPRPFRTVPSGGGLYPLELYVHITQCPELENGLYHFNAAKHQLTLLKKGDSSREIGAALIQPNIVMESSIMIFMTGVFERSTFKYGARGYRFTFIEAGHVSQNINLACNGIGLGSLSIGGYQDRLLDDFLNLDGIRSSTIYLMGIGKKLSDPTQISNTAV